MNVPIALCNKHALLSVFNIRQEIAPSPPCVSCHSLPFIMQLLPLSVTSDSPGMRDETAHGFPTSRGHTTCRTAPTHAHGPRSAASPEMLEPCMLVSNPRSSNRLVLYAMPFLILENNSTQNQISQIELYTLKSSTVT
jgi:hypothetical protein